MIALGLRFLARTLVATSFGSTAIGAAFAGEPPVIKLPPYATTSTMRTTGPTGRERNVGGWLVMNGALFRRSEFPDLANALEEASPSRSDPKSEFVRLPRADLGYQGQSIIRGFALCPGQPVCDDPGEIAPFRFAALMKPACAHSATGGEVRLQPSQLKALGMPGLR
jgi:hypothetical protein